MPAVAYDDQGNPIAAPQGAPTPQAGVAPRAVPYDENGNPIAAPQSWTDSALSNAEAAAKFLGRGVVRAAPQLVDFANTASRAIDKEILKATGPNFFAQNFPQTTALLEPGLLPNTPPPINRADQAVSAIDKYVPLQMDPDAGWLMRHADPYASVVATAGLGGILEAPTLASLPLAVTKQLAMQGAGAAGATAAGSGAQYAGADDLGILLASIAGGGLPLKIGQAIGMNKIANTFADPNAPQTMEDAEALGVKPTFGMLASPRGKMIEVNMAANPLAGGAIKEHLANTQETLNQRVAQEAGNVGYGGEPLDQARTPDIMGRDLTRAAQQKQIALDQASSAAQEAVDTRASAYPPDLSPLVDKLTQLTKGPNVDPTMTGPLDARLAGLHEMIRRQNPIPAGFEPNTVPPMTGSYSALKDWTSNTGKKIQGVDALQGRDLKQVYPLAVDALRSSAEQAGVGDAADAARAQTRTMYREQMPPLREFGGKLGDVDPDTGQQLFENKPTAGEAADLFKGATSTQGDPDLMAQLQEHMPPGAVARGLADIIRNAGNRTGDFRLEHFSPAWRQMNEPAREAIGSFSPETPETLDRVARLSNVFQRKPTPSGLTDTLGLQGAFALLPGSYLGKTLATLALLHGVNSNAMLKAMAGRGGVSDVLSSHLQNLPIQQESVMRSLGVGGQ